MANKAEILAAAAAKQPMITNPVETGTNVITKQEYTDLASFVFNQIVNILSKSYGPYGSMSLICRAGERFSTKDGWRILQHIQMDNNIYYQAIHRMIFEVCEQMNDTVGDGTTTVILMANRMYSELLTMLDEIDQMDLPPREIFHAFENLLDQITEGLKNVSRKFTLDDVRPISMIATNGNHVISDCICQLYERNPEASIQVMESNNLGVSVENVDGLKIPVMLMDLVYVNSDIDKCCDVKDGLYLVFNHRVGEQAIRKIVLPLEQSVKKIGKRLVVIAPSYEENVMVGLWLKKAADEFRATGTCTTILCHYSSTVMGVEGADDLAILLDTHPIDGRMVETMCKSGRVINGQLPSGRISIRHSESDLEVVLGQCELSKLGYETPSFFSGLHPVVNMLEKQKTLVRQEIQGLEDTMTVTEKATSMKLSTLRKRLARLEMKMSVIYYGADSTFDKRMLRDTIDDGVRALESAREHGVIRGSQYDLLDVCKTLHSEAITDLDKILLQCIIRGIQNMLRYDLYGKSMIFQEFMGHNEPEIANMKGRKKKRAENLRNFLEDNNLFDLGGLCDEDPLDMITMKEDPNLITSTETDICAMKAAIELIKILIAGNQMMMVTV